MVRKNKIQAKPKPKPKPGKRPRGEAYLKRQHKAAEALASSREESPIADAHWVAGMLGVDQQVVYAMVRRGELAAVTLSGHIRFFKSAVHDYIRNLPPVQVKSAGASR